MSRLKPLCVLMVLVVFAASVFTFEAFATDRESATSAVEKAEIMTVSSYQAVLEAEQAGASVSGLLVRLDDAGGQLARAKTAYRLGDFDGAISYANISYEISETVKTEAEKLRLEAFGPRYLNVWIKMMGSILGVIVVGLGSFWAWRIFKRRFYRRVLETKPEVVSNEP